MSKPLERALGTPLEPHVSDSEHRLARVTPRQTYVVFVYGPGTEIGEEMPDAILGPFTLRQARSAVALMKVHAEIKNLTTEIPGWALDRSRRDA